MILTFIIFLFFPSIITADAETIEIDSDHYLLKFANLNKKIYIYNQSQYRLFHFSIRHLRNP